MGSQTYLLRSIRRLNPAGPHHFTEQIAHAIFVELGFIRSDGVCVPCSQKKRVPATEAMVTSIHAMFVCFKKLER